MSGISSRSEVRVAFAAAVLMLSASCGDDALAHPVSSLKLVPVTGRILLDEEPVSQAQIRFQPLDGGVPSMGTTDREGRFRLSQEDGADGAVRGSHLVQIRPNPVQLAAGEPSATALQRALGNKERFAYVQPGRGEFEYRFNSRERVVQGPGAWERDYRSDRLNVILIVLNDLGTEWFSCYGGTRVETPNIDALAAAGMKFNNVYAMSGDMASKVTVLTGQYPFRHGWVNDWDVPRQGAGCWFDWDHHYTVARSFRSEGFHTAITGEWKLNDFREQPDALLQHGFTQWCVWPGVEAGNPASASRYWDPFLYVNTAVSRWDPRWPEANLRQYDWGIAGTFPKSYGPDVHNLFGQSLLRRRRMQRLFLYYPMTLASPPYVAPPDASDTGDESERLNAMVRYADTLIGELLSALNEYRRRNRTLIVLTSDNGIQIRSDAATNPEVAEAHQSLKEAAVRVPLIVSCPRMIEAGRESDYLVDLTDLFPTLCELIETPLPDETVLDGRSFAGVLLGRDQQGPREWILSMGGGPARLEGGRVRPDVTYAPRVLRDHRFKVHVNSTRTIDALYDLHADPDESRNLVDSQEAEHLRALEKFSSILATFPESDAAPPYDPIPREYWVPNPSGRNRVAAPRRE